MKETFRLRDLIPIDPTEGSWGDDMGHIAYNFIKRRRRLDESSEEVPLADLFRFELEPTRGSVDSVKFKALTEALQELNVMTLEGNKLSFSDGSGLIFVEGETTTRLKSTLTEEVLTEALTMFQRIKRRQIMRKNKGKIAMGRRRAAMRMASMTVLKRRAIRAAKVLLTKKILKNKSKGDASYGEKVRVEAWLAKRKGAIERIARKLLPKLRQKEMLRRRGGAAEKKAPAKPIPAPVAKPAAKSAAVPAPPAK